MDVIESIIFVAGLATSAISLYISMKWLQVYLGLREDSAMYFAGGFLLLALASLSKSITALLPLSMIRVVAITLMSSSMLFASSYIMLLIVVTQREILTPSTKGFSLAAIPLIPVVPEATSAILAFLVSILSRGPSRTVFLLVSLSHVLNLVGFQLVDSTPWVITLIPLGDTIRLAALAILLGTCLRE